MNETLCNASNRHVIKSQTHNDSNAVVKADKDEIKQSSFDGVVMS